MLEFFLAGLRFVVVVLIYLFLWHILKLMYLELRPGQTATPPADRGRPVLIVLETKIRGLKKGEKYPLGESITIGRDARNDIVINDRHVSARHALITRHGDEWQLQDLESTNGTYVNGQLLTGSQSIHPGDQVRIGDVIFKVGWEDASRGSFPYRPGAAR